MSIVSDKPLKGTCGICGKPVTSLIPGVPISLPGMGSRACSKCGQELCGEHGNDAMCLKCSGNKKGDWCGTPEIPKMP